VVQLGLIEVRSAQVSRNTSKNAVVNDLERLVPFYYVHAGGLQLNYIDPKELERIRQVREGIQG